MFFKKIFKIILYGIIIAVFVYICVFLFRIYKAIRMPKEIFHSKQLENQKYGSGEKEVLVIPDGYTQVIQDYDSRGEEVLVIPDRYNTGCDLSKDMYGPISFVKDLNIMIRENDYCFNLMDSIYNEEYILIENMYIDDNKLFIANNSAQNRTGTIEFVNCYFGEGITIPTTCEKKFVFKNCDFLSQPVTAINAEFYGCKFYKSISDGVQACYNVKMEDCYIFDIGYGNAEEHHADGIQIAGFGQVDAHDIYLNNVRIEVPRCAPMYGQNAGLFIKMDYADGYNMEFKNLILNGGTYTLYIMPHEYKLWDLSFENVKAGYSHLWKNWLNGFNSDERDYGWSGSSHKECGYQSLCYASSVIKEENGTVRFYITNETAADREVKVETDQGEYTLEIPRVLTYKEIEKQDATYEECNIDMSFEVPANKYIKIYDGEELIRYKEF